MQIQTISNSQPHTPNFQGHANPVGPFCPTTQQIVSPLLPRLKKLMTNKKFDLFIKEAKQGECLEFIAKRGDRQVSSLLAANADNFEDLHYKVALYTVNEYEKIPKKTLEYRIQNMIFNLLNNN